MKKAILVTLAILAAQMPLAAHADEVATDSDELTYTVLLAGGPESNEIRIWLTPDGRTYVIDSICPLEVGGTVCEPRRRTQRLICQAPQVAGFEFNADGGDDSGPRHARSAGPGDDARRARPRHAWSAAPATTSSAAATAATR